MTAKKDQTLLQALLKVQQDAPFIDKSAKNPFFKSKYADLPAIWGAVKDLMGENGLLVTYTTTCEDGGEFILSRITHVDTGEFIESKAKIAIPKATAQEYGSYITYMRRYALSAMLGLVTDEDDDGNAATTAQKKAPVKQEAKPETPEAEMYKRIKKQLDEAKTPETLKYVYDGFKADIEKLPKAGQDKLNEIYGQRMTAVSQAPLDADEIPH